MQSRNNFLSIFLLFVLLSLGVLFLSSRHMLFGEQFFQNSIFGVEGGITNVLRLPGNLFYNRELASLQSENLLLREQLVKMHQLESDNAALRDQFQTTAIPSSDLLPAEIIGDPTFFPGISAPENLIIQIGNKDGVAIGDTVVYKNIVVGYVAKTTDDAAMVTLLSNKSSSFTARTQATSAQGVLSGQGNGGIILENVVLSDTLTVGDIVVTNGSEDLLGKGYPPGLTIGKITTVHKNPSSLYQSANIESLLPIAKLTTVFVMVRRK